MVGVLPCRVGEWFLVDISTFNNIDWNEVARATILEHVGPNVATSKIVGMHCFAEIWSADRGVNLVHAPKMMIQYHGIQTIVLDIFTKRLSYQVEKKVREHIRWLPWI